MGIMTAAGSLLAISAGVPATHDAAGFVALTYTVVGMVENLGAIGPVPSKTEFQPLSGPKIKLKGSVDYGSLSPNIGADEADAGQILLQAASAAGNAMYSFKVTKPDGAIRYFRGIVFGFPENIDGAEAVITAKPMIEINTTIVKVAAP